MNARRALSRWVAHPLYGCLLHFLLIRYVKSAYYVIKCIWYSVCLSLPYFDIFSIRSQYFFVCLFVCVCLGFIIPLENFSLIWKITITGEVLQTLTNARHSWPLISQNFLMCRYYYDTGHLRFTPVAERLAV